MALPERRRLRAWLEDVAADTARAATRALRSDAPHRIVRQGASGSPTSALDAQAERVIMRRLRDAPIPLNLLSEEIGVVDRGAEWWVVADPVDGTRNALRGIPFYGVSLAVGRTDLLGVEAGLVRSVTTGDEYWAERGRGAFLNGRRIRTRPYNARESLVGTAIDYERGFQLPGEGTVHFRDLGSAALEMCFVAQGLLDGFLCRQPLVRIIDVAASTLLVGEAGGEVVGLDGKTLNAPFDIRAKFPLIALGHRRLWRKIG